MDLMAHTVRRYGGDGLDGAHCAPLRWGRCFGFIFLFFYVMDAIAFFYIGDRGGIFQIAITVLLIHAIVAARNHNHYKTKSFHRGGDEYISIDIV